MHGLLGTISSACSFSTSSRFLEYVLLCRQYLADTPIVGNVLLTLELSEWVSVIVKHVK
jgi:hypothetical protein